MTSSPTDHIHVGMRVLAADGALLGAVCRLLELDAYLFVEVAPPRSRWKVWHRPAHLFVPMTAIADGRLDHLVLTLDARTARAYTARPEWGGQDALRASGFGEGPRWDGGSRWGKGGDGNFS